VDDVMIKFLFKNSVYCIFIGLFVCAGSLSSLSSESHPEQVEGLKDATATVTQVTRLNTYNSTSNRQLVRWTAPAGCTIEYSFKTDSGQEYTSHTNFFSCFSQGERIKIAYEPDSPKRNYIVFEQKYYGISDPNKKFLLILLAATGFMLAMIGFIFASLSMKK
jgi:hypothetical protein